MTDGPVVIEGHLRYAGDGYEWSELYLDNEALVDYLHPRLTHVAYQDHHWVADPYYPSGGAQPEPWTPVDREAMRAACDTAFRLGQDDTTPYIATVSLSRDYGRVRITIEKLP